MGLLAVNIRRLFQHLVPAVSVNSVPCYHSVMM